MSGLWLVKVVMTPCGEGSCLRSVYSREYHVIAAGPCEAIAKAEEWVKMWIIDDKSTLDSVIRIGTAIV